MKVNIAVFSPVMNCHAYKCGSIRAKYTQISEPYNEHPVYTFIQIHPRLIGT